MSCPTCGQVEPRSPIAPGFWECRALVSDNMHVAVIDQTTGSTVGQADTIVDTQNRGRFASAAALRIGANSNNGALLAVRAQ